MQHHGASCRRSGGRPRAGIGRLQPHRSPATGGGPTKRGGVCPTTQAASKGDVPSAPSSGRARALALTRVRKRRRAARPTGRKPEAAPT